MKGMYDEKLKNIQFHVFPRQSECHNTGESIVCRMTLQRTPHGVPISRKCVESLSCEGGGWIKMVSSVSKNNFRKLLRHSHGQQETWMDQHHHDWFLWVSYLSLYVIDDVRQCCPCGVTQTCGQQGKQRPGGVVCYHAILNACAQLLGVVRGVDLFCNGVLRHGMVPMKYKNTANVYIPFLVVDSNVSNMFNLFESRHGDSYAAKVLSLHWFFGHALPLHVFPIDEDSKVDVDDDVCIDNEVLRSWSELVAMVYSDLIISMINANRSNNKVTNLCCHGNSQHSIRLVNDGQQRKLSMHHHLRMQSTRYAYESGGVSFAFYGSLGSKLSRSLVDAIEKMDITSSNALHGYKQRFVRQIDGKRVGVDDNLFNTTATLRCTRELSTSMKPLSDVNHVEDPLHLCPVYSPPRSMLCVLDDCVPGTMPSFGRRSKRARTTTPGCENEVERYAKSVLQAILGDRSTDYMDGVFSVIESSVDTTTDFHFHIVRLPNLPVLCADHAKYKKGHHAEQHYALRFHGNNKSLAWRLVCWDNQCKMSQLNWSKTKRCANETWCDLIRYVPSGFVNRSTLVVDIDVNAVVS